MFFALNDLKNLNKKQKKVYNILTEQIGRNHVITKETSIEEVLKIRKEVMWPDQNLDFVRVEGDEEAIHLGVYSGNELVSVISLFITGDEMQFRKFATKKHKQGNGYGTFLLNHVLELSKEKEIRRVWCNARKEKSSYYQKFGLICTEKEFVKAGKTYVIMEKLNEV